VMWAVAMHERILTGTTHSALNCLAPVNVTIPGTEVTILEVLPCAGNA